MKKLMLITAFMFLVLCIGPAGATPVLNCVNGTCQDTYASGQSFGTYTNSGTLIGITTGNIANNSGLPQTEALAEGFFGYDVTLTLTGIDYYPVGGQTGTWASNPVANIEFYAVKAASAFALYYVGTADSTGSWSTFDLWLKGYGGNGGLTVSHLAAMNPHPVPEPATFLSLGLILITLATARKIFA